MENASRSYSSKVLKGLTVKIPIINLPLSINPSIIKEIVSGNYDAIVVGGFTDFTTQIAMLFGKLLRKPIVLWSEITGKFLFRHYNLYQSIIKLFVKLPDSLIVPGTLARDYLVTMNVDKNNVFISPNIVDVDLFHNKSTIFKQKKAEILNELCIEQEINILFVGRLIECKGIKYLLDAFHILAQEKSNIGLIIVGTGPIEDDLKKYCLSRNIKNVHFTGLLQGDSVLKYYAISDVFVLPSLFELHPLVIPEAMSCGLPIVTTDAVPSAFDMISPAINGYIVNAGSVTDLANAIELAIDNSKEMGPASLEIMKSKFTLDNSTEEFLNAIKYACVKTER
jgi:glycosyltransferase involved in cell wall biosynthesis